MPYNFVLHINKIASTTSIFFYFSSLYGIGVLHTHMKQLHPFHQTSPLKKNFFSYLYVSFISFFFMCQQSSICKTCTCISLSSAISRFSFIFFFLHRFLSAFYSINCTQFLSSTHLLAFLFSHQSRALFQMQHRKKYHIC